MKELINKNFSELDTLFKAHSKLNTEYMESLSNQVETSHKNYLSHSSNLKENLQKISNETSENFTKAITAVKSDSEQRNSLQAEKAQALEAMMKVMKQMEAINSKEEAFNKKLCSVSDDLELAKNQFSNGIENNLVKSLSAYDLEKEENRIQFHKGISTIQQLNKADEINSEAQINKTIKSVADLNTERVDLFQKSLSTVNENCGKIVDEISSCTSIISEKKEGSNNLIEHNCNDIKEVVAAENIRLQECNTHIKAYTGSLGDGIQQYSSSFNCYMGECVDMLDDFQSKELQVYTPTGQTPMKKEFKYPRVLACTSPHNKIIKRLREENEWSDMDATIVCDEVSFFLIFKYFLILSV